MTIGNSDQTIAIVVTYNRIELLKECLAHLDGQEVPFSRIIVVNNASTDGTEEYLDGIRDEKYCVLHCEENIGGAGGFHLGMQEASKEDFGWVLLIDDDAMLDEHYTKLLLDHAKKFPDAPALAGRVVTSGQIDLSHRRRVTNRLLFSETPVSKEEYQKEDFFCDTATFCGLLISGDAVKRVGLPKKEYFIWCDDTEYCLRMVDEKHKIVVVPEAVLHHKTVISTDKGSLLMRIETKSYYGYRNRYDAARLHIGGLTPFVIRLEYRIFWLCSLLFCLSFNEEKRKQGRFNLKILSAILEDTKSGRLGQRQEFLL